MQCPVCRSEMTKGRFANHGEKWHLQAFGPFGLPLSFSPDGGGESRTHWVGTREGREGHACGSCGTVVLPEEPGAAEEAWVCPACGEVVPGRFDTCWKCQHRRPPPDEIVHPA